MPQPKSAKPAPSSSGAAARKPAAKATKGSKSSPRATTRTTKPEAGTPSFPGRKRTATRNDATPSPAPAPVTTALAGDPLLDPASAESQAARDEALKANLSQLKELLAGGVMLTAQRVQDAMDDAVRRGKMTRRDAEEITRGLVDNGRRQSLDLIAEIEQLFGRSRSDRSSASSIVRESTDRVLRSVDRVRRQAGVGPALPILGYDDLTAAQISSRLSELDAAQLRRVREHERRTANRKSVLRAIDRVLG